VDDLGNILVLGYRHNAYRLHVSEAYISVDLSYYNQQGVPYWGTNVYAKTSGGSNTNMRAHSVALDLPVTAASYAWVLASG